MTSPDAESATGLPNVIRELRLCALLGGGVLLLGFAPLAMVHGWRQGGYWLACSLLLWSLAWWQAWQRREFNRPTLQLPTYPDLGTANRLTLLRGLLIAATGGFLAIPGIDGAVLWLPAALYSAAAILDRIDGLMARRTARTSLLGSQLDTVYDALGLLLAPLLAVMSGKVHWTYLLVSGAYYIFVTGTHWRRRRGLPVHPLPPSRLRRSLAGFQMGYVAVVLWPPFGAHITVPAGFGFMVPVLLGFAVDWLVVSGRINPQRPATATFFSVLQSFSNTQLQPLLRLSAAMAVLALTSVPTSATAAGLWLCAGLLLLGVGGRLAALAILVMLAWPFPAAAGWSVTMATAVYAATGTLLLGSGRFSLWQGDDRWVNRGSDS